MLTLRRSAKALMIICACYSLNSNAEMVLDGQTSNIDVDIGPFKLNTTAEGGADVWECSRIGNNEIVVRVGHTGSSAGFVLVGDSLKGPYALYNQAGLNEKWSWNDNFEIDMILDIHVNGSDYEFHLKPGGKGVYYERDRRSNNELKLVDSFDCEKTRWE